MWGVAPMRENLLSVIFGLQEFIRINFSMGSNYYEIGDSVDEEIFFTNEIRRLHPQMFDNMVGVWQRIARRHFAKDSGSSMCDMRLINSRQFGLDCQDVNGRHGVDFLNDIIPQEIERVRKEGQGRKVRILDSGCGLGFFGDQVRERFGDQVRVFGTSLARGSRMTEKKRMLIDKLRNDSEFGMTACLSDPIIVSEQVRDQILESIGRKLMPESDGRERRMMHANDGKWRSILEMTDYPEFDLIIDTYGELFYTDDVSYFKCDFSGNFYKVCCAALKKLYPGGRLFVASLKSEGQKRFIDSNRERLEKIFGVTIARNLDSDICHRVVMEKEAKRVG